MKQAAFELDCDCGWGWDDRMKEFDWEKIGIGAAWLTLALWVIRFLGMG